jgi:hypothetical protein
VQSEGRMSKVICEVCQGEMMHTGEEETCVGYFSPPGHTHDDNCLTRVYRCACGKTKVLSLRKRCVDPKCDWVGKSTCYCHEGVKLDKWPEDSEENSNESNDKN